MLGKYISERECVVCLSVSCVALCQWVLEFYWGLPFRDGYFTLRSHPCYLLRNAPWHSPRVRCWPFVRNIFALPKPSASKKTAAGFPLNFSAVKTSIYQNFNFIFFVDKRLLQASDFDLSIPAINIQVFIKIQMSAQAKFL